MRPLDQLRDRFGGSAVTRATLLGREENTQAWIYYVFLAIPAVILALAVLRYGRKQQMPFGPYLAAGAIIALLFGEPLIAAYVRTLGL